MSEQPATEKPRVALVTGANQGIGYHIVDQLSKVPNMIVYLCSRDIQKGNEAAQKLNSPNIKVLQLNVNSTEDITKAAQFIQNTHGGLDILVNNAAMAWKGDSWGEEVVRTTFNTNYFGVKKMCEIFRPLLNENGRLVVVSSQVGKLSIIKNESLRKQFEDETNTAERIDELANQFIQAVKLDTYAQEGFPRSCYGMGQVSLNAYVRYLIRNTSQLFKPGVKVYTVCPGYCDTEMSSHKGPRPPSKGAETPVWLALQPPNSAVNPGFYYDHTLIDY